MKHVDVSDDLVEDFEPSELPPGGPDGALEIPALRPETKPPPRLCEAGPCVNYHRFAVQLDAARPIAARVEEGGKLAGAAPPAPFYLRVHHYCYPTVGVETKLGDLPVLECNRWQPKSKNHQAVESAVRAEFDGSEAGQAYQAELAAWKVEQEKIAADQPDGEIIDDAVMFVTLHMADDCLLLLFKNTGDNQERNADPITEMAAPTARELFDTPFIRTEYGPGSYVAWIDRGPLTNRVRVARKIIEVTP